MWVNKNSVGKIGKVYQWNTCCWKCKPDILVHVNSTTHPIYSQFRDDKVPNMNTIYVNSKKILALQVARRELLMVALGLRDKPDSRIIPLLVLATKQDIR